MKNEIIKRSPVPRVDFEKVGNVQKFIQSVEAVANRLMEIYTDVSEVTQDAEMVQHVSKGIKEIARKINEAIDDGAPAKIAVTVVYELEVGEIYKAVRIMDKVDPDNPSLNFMKRGFVEAGDIMRTTIKRGSALEREVNELLERLPSGNKQHIR